MKSRTIVDERGLLSSEEPAQAVRTEPGYVVFQAAGEPATGDFRCAECGYGVCVSRVLPSCPMCAGVSWERGWTRMPVAPVPDASEIWLPAD
jgi:hypothetical protein